jgi:hypothetical protein
MSKPTKRQIAISADLIGRTLHNLGELGVAYALAIDGIPTVFSNVKPLHCDAIIERAYARSVKVAELEVEAEAEKITAIPKDDGLAGV